MVLIVSFNMKIYLARNNIQAGPYSLNELNTMLSTGEVLLNDLIWHTGMTDWKTVGEMTNGQRIYQPHTTTPTPPRGFGDNVDFNPPKNTSQATPQRTSVAELYGRKPSQSTHPAQTVNLSKPEPALEYASISSRFMAFLVNVGLYLLALMPLLVALFQHMDMNELAKASDYASAYAYSQELTQKIPATTVAISHIMLLALIGIQLLLIIMRGQSFGKMVMGVRVVDEKTHKLPKLATLLFMRTAFLVMVYFIGISIASGLPALVMLSINYLFASQSSTRQGWHDKLTKTVVVKAQPIQLDKTNSP